MEGELESYRDRFASIRTGLSEEVGRGMALIEVCSLRVSVVYYYMLIC